MTIMRKKIQIVLQLLIFTLCASLQYGQVDYLRISANVEPLKIKQGNEGILKIKITPKAGYKISTHPEFIIKLDQNNNLSFSKLFFKASELDFQTKQENGTVLLELEEKEVEIRFKVNDDSLLGKQTIRGEIIFTAVNKKDNWALKTYQRFNTEFSSRQNRNIKLTKRK